ncbi:MAG: cation diffusion facilitator family transporter [Myxococcota bacterium]
MSNPTASSAGPSQAEQQPKGPTPTQTRRMQAGRLALGLGILVFAAKLTAYFLTGSTAVLADAMESTINIVSAGMLVFALSLAARPPDSSHPYGHGKVEFISAGIEGAAVAFAAFVIIAEGVRELIEGPKLHDLDLGLALLAASAVVNGGLGVHLSRVGRETDSPALIADGRHVLADVWTSIGVIAGLAVVAVTGWTWADPLIAIGVGIHVALEALHLLGEAFGGLMDEADEDLIAESAARLESARDDSWIDLHEFRSWRSGARRHFDLHLMVPRFFDVTQVHTIHDAIEDVLLEDGDQGDVVVHFDPCEPHACLRCAMSDCAVRETPFERRPPFDRDRVTRRDFDARIDGAEH